MPQDLQQRLNRLRRRSEDQEVLTIKDSIALANSPEFQGTDVFVVASRHKTIYPNLSFAKITGQIYDFHERTQLNHFKRNNNITNREVWSKHTFDLCSIYITADSGIHNSVLNSFSEGLSIIFHGSLLQENIVLDDFQLDVSQLVELTRSGRIQNIHDFANFLEHRLELLIHIVEITSTRVHPLQSADDTQPNRLLNKLCSSDYVCAKIREVFQTGKRLDIPRTPTSTGKGIPATRYPTHIIVVPIRRKADQAVRRNTVFLVSPAKRRKNLDHPTIELLSEYIDAYLTHKYHIGQIETLANLQISSRNQRLLPQLSGMSDIRAHFASFLTDVQRHLFNTTLTHSFSVSEYDPKHNALERIACFEDRHGAEKDPKLQYGRINLSQWRNSVSAFTFLQSSIDSGPVYLRNVNLIDRHYRVRGFEKPLYSRTNTRSEICFPLSIGKISFGTLDLESPAPNGFDADIKYVEAIASIVEDYYDGCMKSNDGRWLIERLKTQESVHELKTFAYTISDIDTRHKILQYISEMEHLDGALMSQSSYRTLSMLRLEIDSLLERVFSHDGRELRFAESMIKYNFENPNRQIGVHIYEAASVIVKNLLTNVVRHGDIERDTVTISTRPKFSFADRHTLMIRLKTNKEFPHQIIDMACVAPIHYAGQSHYGLFLIGVITRAIRGSIAIHRAAYQPSTVIEIRLPIDTETQERSHWEAPT